MMKKYLAEMVGTFVLAFAVALSLTGHTALPTPLMAGQLADTYWCCAAWPKRKDACHAHRKRYVGPKGI